MISNSIRRIGSFPPNITLLINKCRFGIILVRNYISGYNILGHESQKFILNRGYEYTYSYNSLLLLMNIVLIIFFRPSDGI